MKPARFCFFIIVFFLVLSIIIAIVDATSIGVSPAKIFFENETVNKTLFILNSNNATLYFTLKTDESFVVFDPADGKLKPNSKKQIKVMIDPTQDFSKGIYNDIILVGAFKNEKNSFKNGVGIKVKLNVTKDIIGVDYYFFNESFVDLDNFSDPAETLNETDPGKGLPNLITGMAVMYNTNVKGKEWVNLIVVAVLIMLLYLFVRGRKD